MRASWMAAILVTAVMVPQAAAAQPPRPSGAATCVVCHKMAVGERPGIGPNLWGVSGRRAGSGEFNYSPAMKNSKLVWNKANLTAFLMDPRKTVPANKMAFAGIKDRKAAEAVAEYLLKLK